MVTQKPPNNSAAGNLHITFLQPELQVQFLRVALMPCYLSVAILASGCQMAPRTLNVSEFGGSERVDSNKNALDCMKKIANNPTYSEIVRHEPLDGGDPTPAQLADRATPTVNDVKLLPAIHKEVLACRDSTLVDIAKTTPEILPALLKAYREADQINDELISRKTTWAEANRRRNEIKANALREAERIETVDSSYR